MDKSKYIVVLGIAMILVAITGYIYFTSRYTEQSEQIAVRTESKERLIEPEKATTTSELPVIVAPDGWYPYTKEGLDYAFAYRRDWNVDEALDQNTKISYNEDFEIKIIRASKNPKQALDAYVDEQLKSTKMSLTDSDVQIKFLKQDEMSLDGYPAISHVDTYNKRWLVRVVYVEAAGYVYQIRLARHKEAPDISEADEQIFLETFKFGKIVPNPEEFKEEPKKEFGPVSLPPDWKAYISGNGWRNKGRIALGYPPDMDLREEYIIVSKGKPDEHIILDQVTISGRGQVITINQKGGLDSKSFFATEVDSYKALFWRSVKAADEKSYLNVIEVPETGFTINMLSSDKYTYPSAVLGTISFESAS